MKNYKRILSLALALILCLGLTACGDKSPARKSSTRKASKHEEPVSASAEEMGEATPAPDEEVDIIPSSEDDFDISLGVVMGYNGPGGHVVIPDGVTEIGYAAFRGCDQITSVTIPEGVTEIGESAFNSCWNLTSITIPDSVKEIGHEAFLDCISLTEITIPGKKLQNVGAEAFSGCTSLTRVVMPNFVNYINQNAFADCPNLTLYGAEGGNLEFYAEDNNIPFVAIEY